MKTATAPPRMFTVAQVAERLQVDSGTVRGWIKSGALRGINVGRGSVKPRFRIDPADLAVFENQRAVIVAPKPARRRRRTDNGVIRFF